MKNFISVCICGWKTFPLSTGQFVVSCEGKLVLVLLCWNSVKIFHQSPLWGPVFSVASVNIEHGQKWCAKSWFNFSEELLSIYCYMQNKCPDTLRWTAEVVELYKMSPCFDAAPFTNFFQRHWLWNRSGGSVKNQAKHRCNNSRVKGVNTRKEFHARQVRHMAPVSSCLPALMSRPALCAVYLPRKTDGERIGVVLLVSTILLVFEQLLRFQPIIVSTFDALGSILNSLPLKMMNWNPSRFKTDSALRPNVVTNVKQLIWTDIFRSDQQRCLNARRLLTIKAAVEKSGSLPVCC